MPYRLRMILAGSLLLAVGWVSRPVLFSSEGRVGKPVLEPLVQVLADSDDPALQRDVLRGMLEALQGRRKLTTPPGWTAVFRKLSASPDGEVRRQVQILSVLFGDPMAMAELRKVAADPRTEAAARSTALQALLERPGPELLSVVRELVSDKAVRGPAVRALAAFDDPRTPSLIIAHYSSLSDAEKADAIATLASRPAYALALLNALEKKQVARADVTPFIARQLLALKDPRVTERLNAVWGSIRPTAKDKEKLLARYKALATPEQLKKADPKAGHLVFAKNCATCHVLFGEGARIGPELTGAQRTNPEYILTKVLDPNAVVARDYQVTVVTTTNGRVLSGIIKEENDKVLSLQTPTELVRLPKGEVEDRQASRTSLMPEGLLQPLSDEQVRDLLAWLAGPGPRP
jgi:putative heme-binding domain-containing protein